MVVADGNPIVWLSRMASRPVKLAPGSDLVIPLARIAAKHGVPIALLGATAPVPEVATLRLAEETLGLRIATCLAPSQNFDPEGPEAEALLATLGCSRLAHPSHAREPHR